MKIAVLSYERSNDPIVNKYNPRHQKNDVVIHKESGEFFCRIPWFYTGRPTKRTKVITLNCNKYSVRWQ